eukprot:8953742-Alexandrium_andersonii.AAC.1
MAARSLPSGGRLPIHYLTAVLCMVFASLALLCALISIGDFSRRTCTVDAQASGPTTQARWRLLLPLPATPTSLKPSAPRSSPTLTARSPTCPS